MREGRGGAGGAGGVWERQRVGERRGLGGGDEREGMVRALVLTPLPPPPPNNRRSGKWAKASAEEVAAALAAGTPCCYRFRVPANKEIAINDIVRGASRGGREGREGGREGRSCMPGAAPLLEPAALARCSVPSFHPVPSALHLSLHPKTLSPYKLFPPNPSKPPNPPPKPPKTPKTTPKTPKTPPSQAPSPGTPTRWATLSFSAPTASRCTTFASPWTTR